jgi:hypothetical protein
VCGGGGLKERRGGKWEAEEERGVERNKDGNGEKSEEALGCRSIGRVYPSLTPCPAFRSASTRLQASPEAQLGNRLGRGSHLTSL